MVTDGRTHPLFTEFWRVRHRNVLSLVVIEASNFLEGSFADGRTDEAMRGFFGLHGREEGKERRGRGTLYHSLSFLFFFGSAPLSAPLPAPLRPLHRGEEKEEG